ncbi:hypothetical protein L7F22_031805 [Adiantum nelumboides]|nr:hypothetical protein [Adiantum nelumboides]
MGPLPRIANGKLYILVAIDYMTRWVEAQSIAKVNEKTVSKFVYTHICCRFGTPLEIVSDNGPGFRRGLLIEVCEELKISHRHSTPYYPQSNGLVEKANGIITGIIRKMVESKPKRWENFLDGAIWAYRTTYRDATQFTPFHLVYGQEALQPIELNIPTIKLTGRQEQNNDEAWIDRLLNLVELEWKREAAYHCYKKKALQLKDKVNERIKDKEIKEKSLVLRYNNALDNRFDAKFERRWEGPFIVKKAFTGGYYQLMDLNGKEHPRKVNGYRLKPYLSRILPAVFETKQVSKKTKKGRLSRRAYGAAGNIKATLLSLLPSMQWFGQEGEQYDMTSFKTTLGYTPYQLVFGKEAILPIKVQLASLRVLESGRDRPSEQLRSRILELERLELDCTTAIEHYAAQAEHQKQKFDEGLKDKGLKRGMLILRYDNRFDTRKDKKFMVRWEGPFLFYKKYTNGSYRLQDISGKLHKTRVNGWRLKPFFQRFDSQFMFDAPAETEEDKEEQPSSSHHRQH